MEYKFETNINCGGCVARVTPLLNGNSKIKKWQVNTDVPNKLLTVDTDELTADEIISLVGKFGFDAKRI